MDDAKNLFEISMEINNELLRVIDILALAASKWW
jgi:hypothetical protein